MNITQRDLARVAKVSLATVSRALRHDPGVSPETRRTVMNAVRRTGYRHNPLIDAWATNFRDSHRRSGLVLAHVSGFNEKDFSENPGLLDLQAGILERAAEIDAAVDSFHLGPGGRISESRLQSILYGRGIPAVLCGPFPDNASEPGIDWPSFAVVGIGQTSATHRMHRVVHSRYLTLRKALEELLRQGYRRPGLAGFGPEESDASRGWLPAFLQMTSTLPKKDRIPWLALKDADRPVIENWVHKFRPDVILSPFLRIATWSERSEASAPPAFFGVDMDQSFTGKSIPGIIHPHKAIGRGAVDLVVAQMDCHESGLPALARSTAYWGEVFFPGHRWNTKSEIPHENLKKQIQ